MKSIIISYLLGLSLFSQAQTRTPEFQMKLYAQDSRGHRDSVVMGYDTSVTNGNMIAAFGEVDISAVPYDSILDLRLDKTNSPSGTRLTTKKGIIQNSGKCNSQVRDIATSYLTILYHAKYPPVTLSWDSTLIFNTCLLNSFLFKSTGYLTSRYWPGPSTDSALQVTNMAVNSKLKMRNDYFIFGPNFMSNLNNGQTDTIWVLYAMFRSKFIFQSIATNEVEVQKLKGYPNPCREKLDYDFPDKITGEVIVLNPIGQIVYQEKIKQTDKYALDVRGWSTGMYFLHIHDLEGRRYVSMFVKSD
jgi:Secretion system C-terminal sorting domain